MNELIITTHNWTETFQLGKDFARALKKGDILCLFGDLGTGKTTFVKGLAEGLGVDDKKVHSPTFTLMNVYLTRKKMELYHFDLYWIDHAEEIFALDYDEYLYGEGVSVIEWADRLGAFVPKDFYAIDFSHRKEDERQICIRAGGMKSIDKLIESVWPCQKNCKRGKG